MRIMLIATVALFLASCADRGARDDDATRRAQERLADQAEQDRLCRIYAQEGRPDPRCPPPEQAGQPRREPLGVPPLPQPAIPR